MSELASYIQNEFDPAWNAHDVERVVQCFAEDAVVTTNPPMPGAPPMFRGKEEVRAFVQTVIPGFHVRSAGFRTDGERVTWRSTVAADAFRQAGADSIDCDTEAVVRGGRVTNFTVTFTPESVAKLQGGAP